MNSTRASAPSNKAMKLTSPERIEVSQLIAGVLRTVARAAKQGWRLRWSSG